MKILLTGFTSGAMLVLSAADKHKPPVVVNFYSLATLDPVDEIQYFINLCISSEYEAALNVYNDSPWSNIILNRHGHDERVMKIKRTLYDVFGWKPEAIIHIYNGHNPKDNVGVTELFDKLSDGEIPVFSVDGKDRDFERNMIHVLGNLRST